MSAPIEQAYDALARAELELDVLERVLSRRAVLPLRSELLAARIALRTVLIEGRVA